MNHPNFTSDTPCVRTGIAILLTAEVTVRPGAQFSQKDLADTVNGLLQRVWPPNVHLAHGRVLDRDGKPQPTVAIRFLQSQVVVQPPPAPPATPDTPSAEAPIPGATIPSA